jgi:activator of HSP90 ATPase
MAESFEMSAFFPGITAERLYRAWLNGEEHAAMTGSPAQIEPHVGGHFAAWDGYISGVTLELQPFYLIVQAWRTTEFPAEAPDSRLEVWLEGKDGGTQLRLVHTEIPDGQSEDYRQGWEEFYFEPMGAYFSGE